MDNENELWHSLPNDAKTDKPSIKLEFQVWPGIILTEWDDYFNYDFDINSINNGIRSLEDPCHDTELLAPPRVKNGNSIELKTTNLVDFSFQVNESKEIKFDPSRRETERLITMENMIYDANSDSQSDLKDFNEFTDKKTIDDKEDSLEDTVNYIKLTNEEIVRSFVDSILITAEKRHSEHGIEPCDYIGNIKNVKRDRYFEEYLIRGNLALTKELEIKNEEIRILNDKLNKAIFQNSLIVDENKKLWDVINIFKMMTTVDNPGSSHRNNNHNNNNIINKNKNKNNNQTSINIMNTSQEPGNPNKKDKIEISETNKKSRDNSTKSNHSSNKENKWNTNLSRENNGNTGTKSSKLNLNKPPFESTDKSDYNYADELWFVLTKNTPKTKGIQKVGMGMEKKGVINCNKKPESGNKPKSSSVVNKTSKEVSSKKPLKITEEYGKSYWFKEKKNYITIETPKQNITTKSSSNISNTNSNYQAYTNSTYGNNWNTHGNNNIRMTTNGSNHASAVIKTHSRGVLSSSAGISGINNAPQTQKFDQFINVFPDKSKWEYANSNRTQLNNVNRFPPKEQGSPSLGACDSVNGYGKYQGWPGKTNQSQSSNIPLFYESGSYSNIETRDHNAILARLIQYQNNN